MKTFGQLEEVQTLEANSVIPVNNSTDTLSNKITFSNLKAQILADLPDSMLFKGTVGVDGTITSLPAASSSGVNKNTGHAYKVITAGTYQGVETKVGDMLISNGTAWILIPSGDEPTGTVTSVGLTEGTGINVSGGPITSSGSITVSHADTSDQSSITNTGRTYIQSITLDGMGHVTGVESGTETVTNTHYDSNTVVTATNNSKVDAAATNDNVYLNHIENNTVISSHKITGSGATTVTSDSSGNITISSTDNNTTYTFDSTPTQNSNNGITSGGVYSYVDTMITQAISASY